MSKSKLSIKERLQRIKKARPHRSDTTGQIWNTEKQRTAAAYQIQVQGIFASDEGTFLLRRHEFNSKKKKRTPAQWQIFLQKNYGDILRDTILPGMADRTGGKTWRLYRIIGWYTNASAKPKNPTPRTRRNKTKSKGR